MTFFLTELPSLLPIVDVAEALLHVKNGAWFLCLLVANVPDSFNEGKYNLKKRYWGLDDGSVISMYYSCAVPELDSHHLFQVAHNSLPVPPASGYRYIDPSTYT